MTLDDTAAAYGLFQVVFTSLTDHLAIATFRLREPREPGLAFETVFNQGFKQILKQFQDELRQFDGCSPVSDSLHAVREACKIMSTLAVWRNDRIHARVHITEQGWTLYDWRTRRRLEITCEQSKRNIDLAIRAIVELDAHVPHLVVLLRWEDEFDKLYSTIPELSDPPDDTEPDDAVAGR